MNTSEITYPSEKKILDFFLTRDDRPLELQFDSKEEAFASRQRFYAFRSEVKKEMGLIEEISKKRSAEPTSVEEMFTDESLEKLVEESVKVTRTPYDGISFLLSNCAKKDYNPLVVSTVTITKGPGDPTRYDENLYEADSKKKVEKFSKS